MKKQIRTYESAECGKQYSAENIYELFDGREFDPGVSIDDFEEPNNGEVGMIHMCADCVDKEYNDYMKGEIP